MLGVSVSAVSRLETTGKSSVPPAKIYELLYGSAHPAPEAPEEAVQ